MTHGPKPVVAISPHLDDAALGCGAMLARHPGSVVVTVFAGVPETGGPPTPWDAASGFSNGVEAMQIRRGEDQRGLEHLGASPWWLDFLDAQYGQRASTEAIAEELSWALRNIGFGRVFVPMGLFHDDHRAVHEAAAILMRDSLSLTWFGYEEPMYREVPGELEGRLARLRCAGMSAHRTRTSPEPPLEKQRAMLEYRSQLLALCSAGGPGYEDALRPERYWLLRRSGADAYA